MRVWREGVEDGEGKEETRSEDPGESVVYMMIYIVYIHTHMLCAGAPSRCMTHLGGGVGPRAPGGSLQPCMPPTHADKSREASSRRRPHHMHAG